MRCITLYPEKKGLYGAVSMSRTPPPPVNASLKKWTIQCFGYLEARVKPQVVPVGTCGGDTSSLEVGLAAW